MRTIVYDNEAELRSRSNHVLGTRLLPSSVTARTASLEPSKNKDWDNGQAGPTQPLEHTWDWDCLTMHTFWLLPLVLCLLKAEAHICTSKIAEDGLKCSLCLFPWYVLYCVIDLLALPSPWLFICPIGTSGRTWHVESQEFGPKTLVSLWCYNSSLETKGLGCPYNQSVSWHWHLLFMALF
jgi:hypothetical protein